MGLRASEAGFDWAKVDDLLDKVEEEVRELRSELAGNPQNGDRKLEEELGDLLFAVSNVARHVRSDPESCLRSANQKFRRRFQALEEELAKDGKTMRGCTPEQLDAVWESVKARERR